MTAWAMLFGYLLLNLWLGVFGVLLHREEFPRALSRARLAGLLLGLAVLGLVVWLVAEVLRWLERRGLLLDLEEDVHS